MNDRESRVRRARLKTIYDASIGNGFYDFNLNTPRIRDALENLNRTEQDVLSSETLTLGGVYAATEDYLKAVFNETNRLYRKRLDDEFYTVEELKKFRAQFLFEEEKLPTKEMEWIEDRFASWDYKDIKTMETNKNKLTADGAEAINLPRYKKLFVPFGTELYEHDTNDLVCMNDSDGKTYVKRQDGEEIASWTDEILLSSCYVSLEKAVHAVGDGLAKEIMKAIDALTDLNQQKKTVFIKLAEEGEISNER